MDSNKRPLVIIISSPSGAGKTSVCKELLKVDKNIRISISVTTRKIRDNEVAGKDYHFVETDKFQRMIDSNQFIEYAKVFGNYYGSLREDLDKHILNGNDVLFDIDWQGAQQLVKSNYKNIISIFILPPSKKTIEERLLKRQKDSGDNINIVKKRMSEYDTEVSHQNEYNYIVINKNLEKCIEEIFEIIRKEKML